MRGGRRDLNHQAIREGLRQVCGGPSVRDTADLGNDFPDLVVGWKGNTYLFEVKSSPKAKLRDGQALAMASWRGGPWIRIDCLEDALRAMGIG